MAIVYHGHLKKIMLRIHKLVRHMPVDAMLMACMLALVVWQKIRQQPISRRSAGQFCFHLLAGCVLWMLFLPPVKLEPEPHFPPLVWRLLAVGREWLIVVFLVLMGYVNHALPLLAHVPRNALPRRHASSTVSWHRRLCYAWFKYITRFMHFFPAQRFLASRVNISNPCLLYLSNRVLRR